MSVKMKHPAGKGTAEVRKDQVEMYREQGWVEVKSPPKPAAEKPADK